MHNHNNSELTHTDQWTIEQEQVGQRLDQFLTTRVPGTSRTGIQQLITDGLIFVNDRRSKAGYKLRLGDEIHMLQRRPLQQPLTAQPQALPLDVIYEDSDLLVINKAAGMVVHPAPGHTQDTLVNALLARYPELQEVGDETRPGIVHRLDRDTSGLMLVALNARTLATLVEQMQRHEIIKRYLALVEGVIALDQGSIDAPIGRDTRHRQQMTITMRESREARTHFRVLQRFARHTLLLLQLETGRTHQIRVHLRAIGHPVVGDPVYGSGHTVPGLHIERQFLHSHQLQFTHPTSDEVLSFESALPPDLQFVLEHESVL
jgi:23S rRNA pseudouridine1911/1915/1917 synthase